MRFKIVNTGSHSAEENMAIDFEMLTNLKPDSEPTLHIYSWKNPSITYGYFANPEQLLNLDEIKKKGIDIAKRCTGGGVTLHFCDYAFSFFMPAHHPCFFENTLENYRFVNQFVKEAVGSLVKDQNSLDYLKEDNRPFDPSLNYCMAKPTQFDVMYHHQKIGGAAQRKKNNGYLHHGTISIALPDKELLHAIVRSEKAYEAILSYTFAFLPSHCHHQKYLEYRALIEKKLIDALKNFPEPSF